MEGRTNGGIRIELVDDHGVVRSGLRLLIESRSGWSVVAEASGSDEAVRAASREQPDVILLDLDLGADSGLDCLPRLRQAAPAARVLILTGLRDTELHQQAVRLGAAGVVVKDKAADSLLKAIERVHAGETWLDRMMTASLLAELAGGTKARTEDPAAAQIATLTPREREVVSLVSEGLRNKEIAGRLHISEATVRHHLTSIFAKLEVSDRVGLTIYAFRHNLHGRRP
jgi:two-component system, NarL family, nitrate/nitrite response regulator NarL